jgi:lysophospholipase L1-like esterase
MNKLILLAVIVFALVFMSFRNYQKKKRIVFFGDSITELGVKPNGYVSRINELLKTEGKQNNYEIIGSGISGNKVYDLYLRADEDVLAKGAEIVVIYIGVNDVWHKSILGTGTDFDKFGKFYDALVSKFNKAGIKTVICTPAVIGEKTDHTNQQDGDMNKYSQWIRDYANSHHLPLVDLRKDFFDYTIFTHNPENKEAGILTADRVHLNDKGNEFVANAMWKVIREL